MISVVTAAYNSLFLKEAIKSVTDQDEEVEHVIVDDGSDKIDIEAIVNSANQSNINLIRIEHSGPVVALNTAIQNTTGDHIAILDHDDLLLPGSLRMRSDFLSESNFWAVSGGVQYMDEGGKVYKEKVNKLPYEDLLKRSLKEVTTSFWHGGMMYTREGIEKMGLYREDLPMLFDKELILRYIKHGKLGILRKPVYSYRTYSENISRIRRERQLQEVDDIYHKYMVPGLDRTLTLLKHQLVIRAKVFYDKLFEKKYI